MTKATLQQLNVVCALWTKPTTSQKKRYGPEHVNALEQMLQRETSLPVQLWCVTDHSHDDGINTSVNIITLPGHAKKLPHQYPKLWLFSREFADQVGWGTQFLFTDLDVVIVGDLSTMVSANDLVRYRCNYLAPIHAPKCRIKPTYLPGRLYRRKRSPPLSGCFFWFTAGYLRHLWDSFNLSFSDRIKGWTGDEQKWMSYVLGPYVPFWSKEPYFTPLRMLDEQGQEPPHDAIVVVCSHVRKPWDPTLRERNPWLQHQYPIHN